MMERFVRGTSCSMHHCGWGGIARGLCFVYSFQLMDMDQCAQDLAHSYVNRFDDTVALGIACSSGHRLNPGLSQQILKYRTHKFGPLVMDDTNRSWVMQQPTIFKGLSTLYRRLSQDGVDFQKVSGDINCRKST